MSKKRHEPYAYQQPPQFGKLAELQDFLAFELQKIERAFNGVDLDIETRWGSITHNINVADTTTKAAVFALPASYKEGSLVNIELGVLYFASSSGVQQFNASLQLLNHSAALSTQGTITSTATVQPSLFRKIDLGSFTATAALVGSRLRVIVEITDLQFTGSAALITDLTLHFEKDSLGGVSKGIKE